MSEPVPEEQQAPPPSVPAVDEPPVPPVPEQPPVPAQPEQPDQVDDNDLDENADVERQGFDLESFVKSLPDGVAMCPMCLGMGGVVEEPPFDPHTHMCATCVGSGTVRTGSRVSAEAERACADCNGRGWLPNEPGELPATPATAAHFDSEAPPTDYAGRTPDDPDFDWSRVAAAPPPVAEPEPVTA